MFELLNDYQMGSIEMLLIGGILMTGAWHLSKEAISIIRKQKQLNTLNIK